MVDVTRYIEFSRHRKTVPTRFGRTAYADCGTGDVVVFIHGLGLSSFFWRHQITYFSPKRRCIAFDLMAHGFTEIARGQDVSFSAQADMILAALDEIGVHRFDLVGNDSGGAVAQIMAVRAPERLSSLVLTNCDVHNNWPPVALGEIRGAAKDGKLADQFAAFFEDPSLFRNPGSIAEMVFEDPSMATDEIVRINLGPIIATDDRRDAFNRYAGFQDHSQLVVIEDQLCTLPTRVLVVWGNNDVFFGTQWAQWLKEKLPNVEQLIEIDGAKLFFPEERPQDLNGVVEDFWSKGS